LISTNSNKASSSSGRESLANKLFRVSGRIGIFRRATAKNGQWQQVGSCGQLAKGSLGSTRECVLRPISYTWFALFRESFGRERLAEAEVEIPHNASTVEFWRKLSTMPLTDKAGSR
jgi:hypothetical protein